LSNFSRYHLRRGIWRNNYFDCWVSQKCCWRSELVMTFHGMTLEEVEEADDDYHQMWRFYYIVLFAVHRRACLRMLAEDAVAAEDEKAGKVSEKYCRYPAKDWVL
ncbi:hypothetical protein GIB67_027441, partial [Kingdonia uniflora]